MATRKSKKIVPGNGSGQPVNAVLAACRRHLAQLVDVRFYEYASCYLWYDRPLYNAFGEPVQQLPGNTIYLYRHAQKIEYDLFHELGHYVGRKLDLVGHRENGYRGSWEQANRMLIGRVSGQRHWSGYLNRFARGQKDFQFNAASELWAELFMLWHLHPLCDESRLIDEQMASLASDPVCKTIDGLAREMRTSSSSR